MGRGVGLDIVSSQNLLLQKPNDAVIRNNVMKKRDPAEYPSGGRCACIKKSPGGKAKINYFDQQAEHARYTDDGCPTVVGYTEYAPDDGCQERQTNPKQISQYTTVLSPAPATDEIQSHKLQNKSKSEINWILCHARL